MLDTYRAHAEERSLLGIPPLPLSAVQTRALIALLKAPPKDAGDFLLSLLKTRIPPGVDEAAKEKAAFLSDLISGLAHSPLIPKKEAVFILGTMLGGYNLPPLIRALETDELGAQAAQALSHTLLIFDGFDQIALLQKKGNPHADAVLQSWAKAEWFLAKPKWPAVQTFTVFKVEGETNTDDLSPAPDAMTRPDIPLHALAMLKNARPGIVPDEPGVRGPLKLIHRLKERGYPLVYVGDVVGTGSSRKSATNSILWHMGQDLPYIPNKRAGGLCLGGKIAPIFFNTLEDAGALAVELDISQLQMGDQVAVHLDEALARLSVFQNGQAIAEARLKTPVILDEVRAGGRIPLIIGRALSQRACDFLKRASAPIFSLPVAPTQEENQGFTLAQKMLGRACGLPEGQGILPGTYCEPKITSVGSQDTTGPMTRDELKDLACLRFAAPFVLQTFCHTSAYPKPIDIKTHQSLPHFFVDRKGVSLRPGDGVIHSWLNRMILPDTVGTGGDSHTRFPLGISFPAGSGLVAFAAATGAMPLDMPESVLVRFTGDFEAFVKRGMTLRDLVHAIPYVALQKGLLSVEKGNKKNIFSGRILEIEGLPNLKVEQAFELTDASAERSAAACTVALHPEPVIEYIRSNIALIERMMADAYEDKAVLNARKEAMVAWLENPTLLKADKNAQYAFVLEIALEKITEPLLACPNDPDDIRPLSSVSHAPIDEVFIGSCMTNIGHFRAASALLAGKTELPTRLWMAPPTKMDAKTLYDEGHYAIFGKIGARMEAPGCSLCMGNQAQIKKGATAVSTSTRNFPNRLGEGTSVYLASAEVAAVTALLGYLPNVAEYQNAMQALMQKKDRIYASLCFEEKTTLGNP